MMKHRRKKNITDYGKRLKLLKSGKLRLVVRKTNRYVIAQVVESDEAKDKVVLGVNSKHLMKYGLDTKAVNSLRSVTAHYLTGYLIGKQIISKGLETPVLDIGMERMEHGNRMFGFIQGVKDAGLEIPCDENAFPKQERIRGEHLKNKIDVEKIKKEIEKNA